MTPPHDLDGRPWAFEDAKRMRAAIRAEVTHDLFERSASRGCPDNKGADFVDAGDRGYWIPNPHKQSLCWTPLERRQLTAARWEEYKATPRDPATELAKIGETPAPPDEESARRGEVKTLTQAVETLRDTIDVATRLLEKVTQASDKQGGACASGAKI